MPAPGLFPRRGGGRTSSTGPAISWPGHPAVRPAAYPFRVLDLLRTLQALWEALLMLMALLGRLLRWLG